MSKRLLCAIFQNKLLFDEMTMVTMPANLSAEYFFIFIELQVALKNSKWHVGLLHVLLSKYVIHEVDQHATLNSMKMKTYSADRHVTPLRHIILTPSYICKNK